jgi:hypothetical protein
VQTEAMQDGPKYRIDNKDIDMVALGSENGNILSGV